MVAARPRKVIEVSGWGRAALNKVPDDILNDQELKLAQEVVPDNYSLEISKVTWKREKTSTIWRICRDDFKRLALQLPEGLKCSLRQSVTSSRE